MNQDCGGNFKLTADNTTYIKDDCDQCVKYEYKKTKRELISVQVRHIHRHFSQSCAYMIIRNCRLQLIKLKVS